MPRPPRYNDRPVPPRPRPSRRPSGPFVNGAIPVIGLVGGIGAGKSTLAAALVARGAFLLDADAIGHVLLEQSPSRDRVLERFGEAILAPYGPEEGVRREIDRRALASIVFAHPAAMRDLEAILHPTMRKTFEKAISRESRKARVPAIVLDAAILYEAGWDTLCDSVICIDAPLEVRLSRLEQSRGWTLEGLQGREKAQGPLEEKRREATYLVVNAGSPESLSSEIASLWPKLLRRPRRHPGEGLPGGSPTGRSQPTS